MVMRLQLRQLVSQFAPLLPILQLPHLKVAMES